MRSSKSRSRSKSNRNRPPSGGNVINRVFDSSGPEGKVRGTPQQIIDKYTQLARDAQLANDRVATENFYQHAEHYLRLLSSAQREIDQRREEHERQNRERQAERDRERGERDHGSQQGQPQPHYEQPQYEPQAEAQPQPAAQAKPEPRPEPKPKPEPKPEPSAMAVADTGSSDDDSGLVETPESAPKKPSRRSRSRRPASDETAAGGEEQPTGTSEAAE